MNVIHEKAVEIATALTVAKLQGQSVGTGDNAEAAQKLADFYLTLEAKIADGLSKL